MYLRIFAMALLAAAPTSLFAAAWLPDVDAGLAVVTLRDYASNQYWDQDRRLSDNANYYKTELNPYIEYGVTADLAVGTNIFLLNVHQDNAGSRSGLGDIEVFGRYRLWHSDWDVLSAQLLIKAPTGYDKDASPSLGSGQYDFEARLLYGKGGNWDQQRGSEWFFDAETALRKRFAEPEDEFRFDWTLGWRSANKQWEWQVQQENIFALSRSDNASSRWADFDLHKITPSGRYWFTPRTALQLGFTQDIAGRNTGRGSAPFAAIWFRF